MDNLNRALAASRASAQENAAYRAALAASAAMANAGQVRAAARPAQARPAPENNANMAEALRRSAASAREEANYRAALEASAAAPLAAARANAAQPVVVKHIPGGGDCFYASIYAAASERGLLDRIRACLDVDTTNSGSFVRTFRNAVATAASARGAEFDGLYEQLTDPEMRALLLPDVEEGNGEDVSPFPRWMRAIINETFARPRPNKDTFIAAIAHGAATMGNDATQNETAATVRLLATCNVNIRIHMLRYNAAGRLNRPAHLIPGSEASPNLWLQCDGLHYDYFSFNPPAGGRRKRKTRKAKRSRL
jgi:hypothetical protein